LKDEANCGASEQSVGQHDQAKGHWGIEETATPTRIGIWAKIDETIEQQEEEANNVVAEQHFPQHKQMVVIQAN
jgi:hypothetical protein